MTNWVSVPSMQPRIKQAHWMIALLAGIVCSVTRVKIFEPWDQVIDLWDAGVSPLLLAVTGHPHFFRYVTAYPGFLLEEVYPDIGFSLYISLFFAFNVVLWRKISLLLMVRSPSLVAWMVFLAAHFFMNGRGVIAWTGWLLCVSLCLGLVRGEAFGVRSFLLVAISCWLAAVSTGVFIVVVVAFVVFYVQYRRRTQRRLLRKMLAWAAAAPLLGYITQYLVLAIQKNVDFFGGGIEGVIHMLAHGMGRVLFGSELSAVLIVAAAAFSLLFLVFLVKMRRRPFTPLEKLIGFAVGGGLFGLTVLTMAVPLVLLFQQSTKARGEDDVCVPAEVSA